METEIVMESYMGNKHYNKKKLKKEMIAISNLLKRETYFSLTYQYIILKQQLKADPKRKEVVIKKNESSIK